MTDADLIARIDIIKDQVVAAWGDLAGARHQASPDLAEASLDGAELPDSPAAGLAVGHSIEPETGEVRFEMRVTAVRGPNLSIAKHLAANLAEKGQKSVIRSIPPPIIGHVGRGARRRANLDAGPTLPVFVTQHQPLFLGSSVSHEAGSAGTLGSFMRLPNGSCGILSCCHVIALAGKAQMGDPVVHPALGDQPDGPRAEARIGRLTGKFAPLIPRRRVNLDAAIAQLAENVVPWRDGNFLPDLPILTEPQLRGKRLGPRMKVDLLPRGTRVAKLGRSSGYTEGFLTVNGLRNFSPTLVRDGKIGRYFFPDVIEVQSKTAVTPFAVGGDSGALVFTLPDLQPIGIHFCSLPIAEEASLNYIMPIERICSSLNVELA